MLYLVRGKSNQNQQERLLRIHAESAEDAEAIGWSYGVFVTDVELIEKGSEKMTRIDKIMEWALKAWRSSSEKPLKCFGQPVSKGQSSMLLLLGCATWVVNLRMFGFVQI